MTIDQSELLAGRYRLAGTLGRGGMADVYRATDELLGRPVAIKVLREVDDEHLRGRFEQEARTLAGLDHPGLVTLLDAGVMDDQPFLVMSLVEGPTLSARLASGPITPDDARSLGRQLSEALAYAHGCGVVHRDVKPSNVLLCDDRPLLADFGIARLAGNLDTHTRTDETVGSPAYLAPEQVTGDPLTSAVDVYALGLVLLEAMTGVRSYPGAPVEAAIARLTTPPEIPDRLGEPWCSLLARMTARDPADRPSANEVAETLGSTNATPTAGSTQVLAPPAAGEETRAIEVARTRSRRAWWYLAAAAALVVATGMVITLLAATQDPPVSATTPEIPTLSTAIPAKIREPLALLHTAVDDAGRPDLLVALLERTDGALAAHQYTRATGLLRTITSEARAAGAAGTLSAQQAQQVVTAAQETASAVAAVAAPQPTAAPQTAAPQPTAPRNAPEPNKKPGPKGKAKGHKPRH